MSTKKELNDTIKKRVQRKSKRTAMPKNRHLIDSKLVFTKKIDG